MKRSMRKTLVAAALSGLVVLTGCAQGTQDEPEDASTGQSSPATEPSSSAGHEGMEHKMNGGPVPEGMEEAQDPKYRVGSKVTLTADHMEGMNGAEGSIASSTDQTVYVVDYEADGMMMKNHKWVVESEMKPVS